MGTEIPAMLIRTKSRPECPVCSSNGTILYSSWKDRILGLPGEWTWKRCDEGRCGTVWQDPVTLDEDLPLLYLNYPTHADHHVAPTSTGTLQRIRDHIRNAYLHISYGYESVLPAWVRSLLAVVPHLHPAWRDTQAASVFYLPAMAGGRVLDVGCGNGSSLRSLERRGWHGVGIDFDEAAIQIAREQGVEAYVGDLASQKFPPESFDAIMMNHVIEHVPSPEALLRECRRILKKDGILIAITPNANSRGHQRYGKDWRGFEPDHLQIFTVRSLAALGTSAGFTYIRSFSSLQGVDYLLDASEGLARYDKPELPVRPGFYPWLKKHVRWFTLGWIHVLLPGRDEVAVLSCKK